MGIWGKTMFSEKSVYGKSKESGSSGVRVRVELGFVMR